MMSSAAKYIATIVPITATTNIATSREVRFFARAWAWKKSGFIWSGANGASIHNHPEPAVVAIERVDQLFEFFCGDDPLRDQHTDDGGQVEFQLRVFGGEFLEVRADALFEVVRAAKAFADLRERFLRVLDVELLPDIAE